MSGPPVVCQAGWIGKEIVNVFGHPEGKPYRTTGYDRCHRPATHRFSSGCVHEHLMTWLVCAECAYYLMDQWRREQRGLRLRNIRPARCVACFRADGHDCPVLASAEAGLEVAV